MTIDCTACDGKGYILVWNVKKKDWIKVDCSYCDNGKVKLEVIK